MKKKTEILVSIGNSLIAAIPLAGGSINSLISDYQAERKLKRLKEFYESIREDLNNFESKVNQDYISKPDFLDVFEETARRITNERTEQKRLVFKNILVNSIIKEEIHYDYTEENLRLLDRLRNEHLFFLKLFHNPRKINSEKGSPLDEGGGFSTSLSQLFTKLILEWHETKILDICQDLENERLLENFSGSYKTMLTDKGINHLENKLTEKGTNFVESIELQTKLN